MFKWIVSVLLSWAWEKLTSGWRARKEAEEDLEHEQLQEDVRQIEAAREIENTGDGLSDDELDERLRALREEGSKADD